MAFYISCSALTQNYLVSMHLKGKLIEQACHYLLCELFTFVYFAGFQKLAGIELKRVDRHRNTHH